MSGPEALELRCRIDRVFSFGREVGKEWFEAARNQDLRTMKRLYKSVTLKSVNDDNTETTTIGWRLLHYDGQGTSYGFVGSTALHWAAANNDVAMLRFLLSEGISVNVQNRGGSTALHSAVANGSEQAVLLLLQHGANAQISDCCGDTPFDLMNQFVRRCEDPNKAAAARAMLLAYSALLRLVEETDTSKWALRDLTAVRSTLLEDASSRGSELLLDRDAVVSSLMGTVQRMRVVMEKGNDTDAKAISFLNDVRRRAITALQHPIDKEDSEEAEFLKQKADAEKAEGNRLFQQGDFSAAIRHYTTAIALFPAEHTYYSNRAACHLKLSRYKDALKDSAAVIELKPDWAKGHHRLGSAWVGLGQYERAAAAFRTALTFAPDDECLLRDLNEATAAIPAPQVVTRSGDSSSTRKPWFDCVLCDNKTRDQVVAPCCNRSLCGTCWRRRQKMECPFCKTVCP